MNFKKFILAALLSTVAAFAQAQPVNPTSIVVGSTAIIGGVEGECLSISSARVGSAVCAGGGGGSGTVTSVSVVTANGVSGSVATATTTPAITLTLGAITPTTVNGNTITTGTGVLTLAASKTLTVSNTLTLTGTDASSVAFGAGGTVAYTNVATLSSLASIGTITTGVWNGTIIDAAYLGSGSSITTKFLRGDNTWQTIAGGGDALTSDPLSQFASTTSSQLAGVISNETGAGVLVFNDTPTLITPVLGVATATSVNKVAITAPASSATLTIADGKTLTASNTLTLTGTDAASVAFGAGGTVVYTNVATLSSLASIGTITTGTWQGSIISAAYLGSGSSITTKFLRGDNTWQTISGGGDALTSGTLSQFAATTSAELAGVISNETGTGVLVFATTPTLVTPVLGVATATSINKVAITAPATSATITVADDKTLTVSNTLTFTGTDSSSIALGAGGTVLYSGGDLGTPSAGVATNLTGTAAGLTAGTASAVAVGGITGLGTGVATFLATSTSANLIAAVTDETGTGALVFANTPTLVTPVLGVATATTINKVALTAPATAATLTILNNKTFTVNHSLTLAGTDSTTMTFPTTTATIARTDAAQTFTGTQTFGAIVHSTINGNTWATGTGTLSIGAGKTLTASNTITFTATDSQSWALGAVGGTVLTTSNTSTVTKGFTATPASLGTMSSFTIDIANGNYQYGTNNGNFTLTAPTSDGGVTLHVTNGASAGTITFSGFTVGSSTGDALTTTNTHKFRIRIERINAVATYMIQALQ